MKLSGKPADRLVLTYDGIYDEANNKTYPVTMDNAFRFAGCELSRFVWVEDLFRKEPDNFQKVKSYLLSRCRKRVCT
jgi:hypothetical protein